MKEHEPITGGLRQIIEELSNRHPQNWKGFEEAKCILCGPLKSWLPTGLLCSDGTIYTVEKIELAQSFVPNNELEKVGGSIEDILFTATYDKKISPKVLSKECLEYLEQHPEHKYPKEEVLRELENAWREHGMPAHRKNLFSRLYSASKILFGKTNSKELHKESKLKMLGHFKKAFELGYFPNDWAIEQKKYTTLLHIFCLFNHPDNKEYTKAVTRVIINSIKSREKESEEKSTILVSPKTSKNGYEVRMTYEAEMELFSGDSDETIKKMPPYGRIEKEVWLKFTDELIDAVKNK